MLTQNLEQSRLTKFIYDHSFKKSWSINTISAILEDIKLLFQLLDDLGIDLEQRRQIQPASATVKYLAITSLGVCHPSDLRGR